MKTCKLTGIALDWAVAKCEGLLDSEGMDIYIRLFITKPRVLMLKNEETSWSYSPSTDWAQGGPIVERQRISAVLNEGASDWRTVTNACSGSMFGQELSGDNHAYGSTLLIAAMRCYVISKLGQDIDLPEGLK